MSGAVHTVIVCKPAQVQAAPCPAGEAPDIVSAYLIAPSAQGQFEAALQPLDFSQSIVFSGLAFGSILALWSLGLLFGSAKRAVR